MNSLIFFLKKFSTDDARVKFFTQIRVRDGAHCVFCHNKKLYKLKTGVAIKRAVKTAIRILSAYR